MDTTRIPPQQAPYALQVQQWFDRLMPPGVAPLLLFRTLARNPRVFERFMAGGLLDKGSIPLRQREILINRTCARCRCEYEWGVHVAFFGERAGLTLEELWATVHGAHSDPVWAAEEQLLLRLVDELHETTTVSEALWQALSTCFSNEQLLECLMLVGFYHMVSFMTNALALPPEGFGKRFPHERCARL